jgi:hypothetical protein
MGFWGEFGGGLVGGLGVESCTAAIGRGVWRTCGDRENAQPSLWDSIFVLFCVPRIGFGRRCRIILGYVRASHSGLWRRSLPLTPLAKGERGARFLLCGGGLLLLARLWETRSDCGGDCSQPALGRDKRPSEDGRYVEVPAAREGELVSRASGTSLSAATIVLNPPGGGTGAHLKMAAT